MRMDKLIKVFADTQEFCKTDSVLKEAVSYSMKHTKLYEADEYPELPRLYNELCKRKIHRRFAS